MKSKELLIFLIKTSRPRFWSYLFGTFLLGFFISIPDANIRLLTDWKFIVLLLYFLFPANLFVYGINDLSDEDTDKFNTKKGKQEILLQTSHRRYLKIFVALSIFLGVLISFLIKEILILMLCFLMLSAFYSAPPFRFKMKPFIDSISNVFYILPGLISYTLNVGQLPTISTLLIISIWPIAMHLYSAIPDIDADQKAGLRTTAVVIGENLSLIFCAILWSIFTGAIILSGLYHPISLILLVYPLLPLLNLNFKKFKISKTYWYFPYINFVIGFGASMLVIYNLYLMT